MRADTPLTLAVCLLIAALAITWASWGVRWAYAAWHRRTERRATTTLDVCEVCGKPATHELAGPIEAHADAGGFSAMVACYCKRHRPRHAVRVR